VFTFPQRLLMGCKGKVLILKNKSINFPAGAPPINVPDIIFLFKEIKFKTSTAKKPGLKTWLPLRAGASQKKTAVKIPLLTIYSS
jgi:hypothetical protein